MALRWCRPEDLNPQPTDYKSVALPIELGRLLKWWRMTGSNRRPSACKADALPAELILRFIMLGNVLLSRNVSPTTIGAKELNFCVRHGNRCDLFAIVTKQFFYIVTNVRIRFHFVKYGECQTSYRTFHFVK